MGTRTGRRIKYKLCKGHAISLQCPFIMKFEKCIEQLMVSYMHPLRA